MDDVIALVEKLAATIVANPRTKAFREATVAVEADADARKLQEEYAAAIGEVRELEATGQAIEPEQKRTLAALGERIRKSPLLQKFLRANMEFNEMMDAVQHTLGGAIEGALFPDAHAGHNHAPGESCGHDHGHADGHGHGGEAEEPPAKDKGPILWTP
jgi:cell fate (sporulation/competence/biofilm development) regulator YlbF (YheA/YmcA/DUF963 family)